MATQAPARRDPPHGCGEQLVRYIAGTAHRTYPPEVIEAALQALVDHLGCAVGAWNDPPSRPVRATVKRWNAGGRARVYLGGLTTPALAVLANATMAHAMDYDDTHPGGAGHALRDKFEGLVEPVLGARRTATLFSLGQNFLEPGSIGKIGDLLAAD